MKEGTCQKLTDLYVHSFCTVCGRVLEGRLLWCLEVVRCLQKTWECGFKRVAFLRVFDGSIQDFLAFRSDEMVFNFKKAFDI